MAAFEVNILGASGGPLEGGNQGILLSEAGNDPTKNYICIDAGSGLRQIASMMADNAKSPNKSSLDWGRDKIESLFQNIEEPMSRFVDKDSQIMRGLGPSAIVHQGETVMGSAVRVFDRIKEWYITHPHLDHIAALAINSPACGSADKRVWGLRSTVDALKNHIFNDVIWPNLLVEPRMNLKINALEESQRHIVECIPNWFITPLRVSHGTTVRSGSPCTSTVYLIEDSISEKALLICGDLESDLVSKRRFVSNIWKHLGKAVAFEKLRAIVIECSCSNTTKDEHLFGHLSPRYLVYELKQLSQIYRRKLDGLHVIIMHTKMEPGKNDPRLVILEEVRRQAEIEDLGKVIFSIAVQGYTFVV